MDRLVDNWFSLRWFIPEVLQSFTWEQKWWLYLLPIIPLLFLLKWLFTQLVRQTKLPVALNRNELKNESISYLRFIPPIFLMLFLALIIVALARPQTSNEQVEQSSEGIDIVLNIDISESMKGEDFLPNRLESAKEVARNFVKGRFQDRIGLVVFSGEALPSCPLTTDYGLLNELIDEINSEMVEASGTAIGNSITSGVNFLREAVSNSKIMILLSDGDNTAGNIDPLMAAKLAKAYNIKIYAIAIGRDGKVPYGRDYLGRPMYVENQFDETNLRKIAKIGDGKFYRVSDKKALENVFQEIDKLERAEIKETRYSDITDYYPVYLKWALIFFFIWLFFKSTFLTNLLTD